MLYSLGDHIIPFEIAIVTAIHDAVQPHESPQQNERTIDVFLFYCNIEPKIRHTVTPNTRIAISCSNNTLLSNTSRGLMLYI